MPRRSRTRGASGSGKTKRPPVATPEAHREFEAQLDEVYDALMSRDRDRLARALEALVVVPPFAPDVITRRMIEGRERAPGIVLAMLGAIAQERTPIYLQRIIKARDAPDQVRYEAQRMLGWDSFREEKHRAGFLKSLRDPYGALATSTASAGTIWPARVEALAEVAAYLRALEPPARIVRSGDLIDHEFFESWAFPFDLVADVMRSVQPPDDGVMTDAQYEPLIAALADDATTDCLRDWLQRQAWLLDRDGKDDARDLALAVAASLRDADPDVRGAHPFLRALVDVSVAGVLSDPYIILEDMLMAHGISITRDTFP